MSGKLAGAVLERGPQDETRWTLSVLAVNADDFGFTQLRQDTIARHRGKDERTIMRHLQKLAAQGWLQVVRKAVDGCGNVYFLNVAKLGSGPGPKSGKSPLHREFLARTGDKWHGARFTQPKCEKRENAGDIPQGSQVTENEGQVTKTASTGDKPTLANKEDSLLLVDSLGLVATGNDDDGEEIFPSDAPEDESIPDDVQVQWLWFLRRLQANASPERQSACHGWTLEALTFSAGGFLARTSCADPQSLQALLLNTGPAIAAEFRGAFKIPQHFPVRFDVQAYQRRTTKAA